MRRAPALPTPGQAPSGRSSTSLVGSSTFHRRRRSTSWCPATLWMSMAPSLTVGMIGVLKSPSAGGRRGCVLRLSRWCSLCRALGDGDAGGGVIDDGLVQGVGGDEGLDGEVVHGTGQAADRSQPGGSEPVVPARAGISPCCRVRPRRPGSSPNARGSPLRPAGRGVVGVRLRPQWDEMKFIDSTILSWTLERRRDEYAADDNRASLIYVSQFRPGGMSGDILWFRRQVDTPAPPGDRAVFHRFKELPSDAGPPVIGMDHNVLNIDIVGAILTPKRQEGAN